MRSCFQPLSDELCKWNTKWYFLQLFQLHHLRISNTAKCCKITLLHSPEGWFTPAQKKKSHGSLKAVVILVEAEVYRVHKCILDIWPHIPMCVYMCLCVLAFEEQSSWGGDHQPVYMMPFLCRTLSAAEAFSSISEGFYSPQSLSATGFTATQKWCFIMAITVFITAYVCGFYGAALPRLWDGDCINSQRLYVPFSSLSIPLSNTCQSLFKSW